MQNEIREQEKAQGAVHGKEAAMAYESLYEMAVGMRLNLRDHPSCRLKPAAPAG